VIGLLQRVCRASVEIDARVIAAIDTGLLVFIGVEKDDSQAKANRLLERLLGFRVFPDADGKMNLSLAGVQGGLLLVPQFTLPADTKKGMRPSFSSAAAPELGQALFHHLVEKARAAHPTVAAGEFGAHMRVHLVNDGPVTFWLQT
jgi:D-tyrosyl-tRNA(Tyr) deacylase